MSGCTCDSSSACVRPLTNCSALPRQLYPYNVPYTANASDSDAQLYNNWVASQTNTATSSAPFTTNPNWPLNTGSDSNQIRTNMQAKTVFRNINQRKENGTLLGTGFPIFKSNHEKILYIQAQYSQPRGAPGVTNVPNQGINTLFS
jgi:hypothetical protein